jgi:hypothetical protein
LARALSFRELNAALCGTFSPPAYPDSKLFLPINPLRTFLVDDKAFALQKQMEPSTTKSLSLLGKFFKPFPKGFIPIPRGLITQSVSPEANETTGPPLTQPKAVYDINCCLSPCLGL